MIFHNASKLPDGESSYTSSSTHAVKDKARNKNKNSLKIFFIFGPPFLIPPPYRERM